MVRTRNNAEGNIVSSRQTTEKRMMKQDESKTSTTVSKSNEAAASPSTERRATRRGNRRGAATKNSSDSDIENEMEPRKKSTRSRANRKGALKNESYSSRPSIHQDSNLTRELDRSSLIHNVIVPESRKRTRKDEVLIASYDNSISIDNEPFKQTAAEITRSQTVATRKNEVQSTNPTIFVGNISLMSEDESPAQIRTNATFSGMELENSLIREDNSPLSSQSINATFTTGRRRRTTVVEEIIDTPKKLFPQKKKKTRGTTPVDIVTPQSSPIVVNLTPHRSFKTPKKSPVNLSSPKTHSQSPLRLSKTPRKLPVTIDSPVASEKSGSSSSQSSRKLNLSFDHVGDNAIVVLSDIKKSSVYNFSNIDNWHNVELPSNKNQACKSGSPSNWRSTVLASKIKKSPKRLIATASSSQATVEVSNPIETPVKTATLDFGTRLATTSAETSTPPKTPMSLDKKGLLSTTSTSRGKTEKSNEITANLIANTLNDVSTISSAKTPPNKKVSLVRGESRRRLRSSMKKRSPITTSGTPLRRISPLSDKSTTHPVSMFNPESPCSVSLEKNARTSTTSTLATITPRNLIRRSPNLTPDFKTLSSNATSSPIEQSKNRSKNSQTSRLALNDLEKLKTTGGASLELLDVAGFLNESDNILGNTEAKKDGTYNVSEEITFTGEEKQKKNGEECNEEQAKMTKGNVTYEVAEPKTPSLQIRTRKRSSSTLEPSSCTRSAKKRCKVRFASTVMAKNSDCKVTVSRPDGSKENTLPDVNSVHILETSRSERLSRDRLNINVRRRSCSLTNMDEKRPVEQGVMKRRSISTSNLTNKIQKLSAKTQDSVNRLSRPRNSIHSESKPDVRTASAKKAPNFAKIHQKIFGKMESLVDAKKRVARRHLELNNVLPAGTSKIPFVVCNAAEAQIPRKLCESDTGNGQFNRFGFRIRKTEAIIAVTKQTPAKTRNENKHENRRVLKGVRTNRRFELQMKLRKMT